MKALAVSTWNHEYDGRIHDKLTTFQKIQSFLFAFVDITIYSFIIMCGSNYFVLILMLHMMVSLL